MWNTYKKTISLIFIIFLFYPIAAHSTDYYVSTTGSDSNSGTLTLPWKTVQKAATTMVAGDTAYVRGGTYSEYSIKFSNSGSSGSPITIKGYTGETAVIDGGFTTASGRYPVFDIDNVNYITLDGLTIKRGDTANVYIAYNYNTTNIVIKNCDLQDFVANDNSGQIYMNTNSDNVLIEKNKLHGAQGTGGIPTGIIVFHGDNITIRNNNIFDNNTTGGLGGTGIMFKHNKLSAPTTLVENNLIYNHTRYGMLLNRANAIVRNNIIHDISGLGILVFEESAICSSLLSDNNQILHNLIVDVGGGIKLDRSSSCVGAVNTIVRDNLTYNCTDSANRCISVYPYYSTDSSNTTFSNNIIYSTFSSPIRVLSNYYTTSSAPLTGSNNQQAQPLFRNYSSQDFTLTPISPGWHSASDATDVGVNTSLVGINGAPLPPQPQ